MPTLESYFDIFNAAIKYREMQHNHVNAEFGQDCSCSDVFTKEGSISTVIGVRFSALM